MTDLQLQTTPEQRAELARLAGEATPGPWKRSRQFPDIIESGDGEAIADYHHRLPHVARHNAAFGLAANPATITALLSDLAALEAECQRLRERAEVGEQQSKLLAEWWERDTGLGCAHDALLYAERDARIILGLPEQARAALGVAPEPQGDDCGDSDEEEKPYNACDCCGTSMIDDTEIGCGTCYPCQAEIARLSEEAPDEP